MAYVLKSGFAFSPKVLLMLFREAKEVGVLVKAVVVRAWGAAPIMQMVGMLAAAIFSWKEKGKIKLNPMRLILSHNQCLNKSNQCNQQVTNKIHSRVMRKHNVLIRIYFIYACVANDGTKLVPHFPSNGAIDIWRIMRRASNLFRALHSKLHKRNCSQSDHRFQWLTLDSFVFILGIKISQTTMD